MLGIRAGPPAAASLMAPTTAKLTTLGFLALGFFSISFHPLVFASDPCAPRFLIPELTPNGIVVHRPPPCGGIRALHFSRDGRFVLAQDHEGITILNVQPFSIACRIPVEDAKFAGFTPNSQEVVFISPPDGSADSHVERWRLTDGNQVGSFKIATAGCVRQELSPDGRILLCSDRDGTVRAIDVTSRETILEQRKFEKQGFGWRADATIGAPGNVEFYFSPDGRFVISRGITRSIAWDLRQKAEVPLAGQLKHGLRAMAFMEPERIILPKSGPGKLGTVTADLVEFPSGSVVSTYKIPPRLDSAAADPEFVIVRPFGILRRPFDTSAMHGAAAANLATGLIIVSDYPVLDVSGHFYVTESDLGEVGLYEIGKGLQAKMTLPSQ